MMAEEPWVIVGGGVVGLSIAYVLAEEGLRVRLLDRQEPGRAASWAGAGILPPGSRRGLEDPLVALRTLSAAEYPRWSETLLETTGIDNGYRRCGGLDVACDESDLRELEASCESWKREGIDFERLEGPQVRTNEPELAETIAAAAYLPGRAQIRNPRHLQALRAGCAQLGVEIEAGVEVVGFRTRGGHVTRVSTRREERECAGVVLAAGAWTQGLAGTLGIELSTPPVKGQIVLLNWGRPRLRRIVEHGSHYLVPRDDGRVLVGATEELAGFDVRPSEDAAQALLSEAIRLCPGLAEADVETTWAGLRPGSRDGRPYLGRVRELSNVIVATGHRRAGLQLSTGTALVVSDMVAGRAPRVDVSELRPERPQLPVTARAAFRS